MKLDFQAVVNTITLLLGLERALFHIAKKRSLMSSKNPALIGLVDLILDGVAISIEAGADGKVTLSDAALLLKLMPDLGPAFQSIGTVPAELSALDEAAAAELVTHVMEKLVVADAEARAVVDASLKAAVAVFQLVVAIKALAVK